MPCLSCGAPNTIDAHLIPKAFIAEVKVDPGERHLILHGGKTSPIRSHTGIYDRDILCGTCDALLGDHEGYAVELLRECRAAEGPPRGIITFEPVDGDRLIRFAAGIAWKYAVTGQAGRIDIGPYVGVLADVALRRAAIPDTLDLAMMRIVELDGDVYFYRTPMPDRKEGVNMVRFTVGSFLIFLKIDKRRPGSLLPPECWLRGRTAGAFVMTPAELVEEGRLHRALASSEPSRNFFRAMRAGQARRQ